MINEQNSDNETSPFNSYTLEGIAEPGNSLIYKLLSMYMKLQKDSMIKSAPNL